MADAPIQIGDSLTARLLFRRGFLCHPTAEEPAGDATWRQITGRWTVLRIGAFTLRAHPETPVRVAEAPGHHRVLIGDAFSTDDRPVESLLAGVVPVGEHLEGLEALESLSGRFALLVLEGSRCFALNDAFGARSLFYRKAGGTAISSHAQLLAHAFRIHRRADVLNLLATPGYMKRPVKYLPGHATLYDGVQALIPNNYVEATSGRMRRYWPCTPNAATGLEAFLAAGDGYFDALVRFVAARGWRPVFGVTGGADSRAVFAAFTGRGAPFRGVTWLDQYLRDDERATVEAIVERFGIDHAFLSPNGHEPAEVSSVALRNSGNVRSPNALVEGMHALFGADPQAVFVRGYGGEILRGFYNVMPHPMKSLAPREMTRMYGAGLQPDGRMGEYMRLALACFESFHDEGSYAAVEGLGYDPCDLFYWEHRMGMWGSAMLNEMDPAVHSIVGLNSRRLYRLAFGLPGPVRLTKELMRALADRNDGRMSGIPLA
jgi:hypothetical protein